MTWFEQITGFRELPYAETRAQLEVVGKALRSKVNGHSAGIGTLELVSLQVLRERVRAVVSDTGGDAPSRGNRPLTVGIVQGGVRAMHSAPEFKGALFQVASQFNLLEMTGPDVSPEHGVTRYIGDPTQGPACAIAAGAATIYRNYFADVDGDGGQSGQTHNRQLNGLADMGNALSTVVGLPVDALWSMRNGYALCARVGLDAIAAYLAGVSETDIDALRGTLRIGVHSDVEVTDKGADDAMTVSQAFCSALPVAYGSVPAVHWAAFATMVLEASYEATLWAAVLNAHANGSNIVLLTRLGGGVFGNDAEWIDKAMRRALGLAQAGAAGAAGLDVRLVCYNEPTVAQRALVRDFA